MPTGKETDYLITVKGIFNANWSDWFCGIETTTGEDVSGNPVTIFSGRFPDQAALRGVLIKLWDLNATVISIQQMGPAEEEVNHNGGLDND
jgi:hypothetical protein